MNHPLRMGTASRPLTMLIAMGNPLRRRSDRIESLLMFALVMAFLAAAPGLCWWAGRSSYLADVRAREWERTHVFEVTASLVGPVPLTGLNGTLWSRSQRCAGTRQPGYWQCWCRVMTRSAISGGGR